MNSEKGIIAFSKLGECFRRFKPGSGHDPGLEEAVKKASRHNGWFTEENIVLAVRSLGEMLEEKKMRTWAGDYRQSSKPREVGVVMAGNIPLVGFHDFLCVLMSGHNFVGKLSSDDEHLLPAVAKILTGVEPNFKDRIQFTNQPFNKSTGISAFIATGSNNSARYFEYYFSKHPHIIRRNRNSVAVLNGAETEADLKNLGKDIFQYFGLGCRNVSKLFIPEEYKLDKFFEGIVDFGDVIHHNKYYNNHNYYRSIYLLNSEKFLDNNFLMVKEAKAIASPVATLYYERYKTKEDLYKRLQEEREHIQCIVGDARRLTTDANSRPIVHFGQTQSPELWDYADGVDTMKFLEGLLTSS